MKGSAADALRAAQDSCACSWTYTLENRLPLFVEGLKAGS
jgi:hypothetical protein